MCIFIKIDSKIFFFNLSQCHRFCSLRKQTDCHLQSISTFFSCSSSSEKNNLINYNSQSDSDLNVFILNAYIVRVTKLVIFIEQKTEASKLVNEAQYTIMLMIVDDFRTRLDAFFFTNRNDNIKEKRKKTIGNMSNIDIETREKSLKKFILSILKLMMT